jgi:voltage-gated sodium channel
MAIAAVRDFCRGLIERPWFVHGVLALIVVNAVAMGVETSATAMAQHGFWLMPMNAVIQAAFVVEIAIRLLASRSLTSFFRDGWNCFDFVVVTASLLPVAGPFATVARLVRVLRVARLVSMSAELRLIVGTMLRSIPSMGHVVLLLGVLMYIYGIVGFYLFHADDPTHWGTLGVALLSLFQVITLEGWPDMQAAVIDTQPWAWAYFASFVIVAVFVVINLFIAVVLNNLQALQGEERLRGLGGGDRDLVEQAAALRAQLERFEATLQERDAARQEGTSTRRAST